MSDTQFYDPEVVAEREEPHFAEAYPRLDFIKAQRAIQENRTICVFERAGRGRVGQFEFGSYEADEPHEVGLMLGLVNVFPDRALLGSKCEVAFRIRSSPIGVNHHRDFVLCPACEGRKTVLIYVSEWKCQKCHGLLMRSQLIDPGMRLREKLVDLHKECGKGRPKGMHNASYQAKLKLIDELEARAARLRINPAHVVALEHDRVVSSRWVSMAEDAEFQAMFIPWVDE